MTHVIIGLILAAFALIANAGEWDRELAKPPEMSAELIAEAKKELLPENIDKTKTVLASEHFAKHPEKLEGSSPVNMVEYRGYRGSGDYVARAYFEKSLSENAAIFLAAAKARGFESVIVGPAYYITPDMEVGVGVGTSRYAASDEGERFSHATVSSFFYWKTDKIESEVVIEKYSRDPSLYHYAYIQTPIFSQVSAGIFSEKDVGWGPRISWAFSKNANLWIVPIVKKTGDATIVVGVQRLY